jgi:hypothetical protein
MRVSTGSSIRLNFTINSIKSQGFLASTSNSIKSCYQWNVSFIRVAHDWEVDVLASFFKLYSLRVRWGGKDKFCWPTLKDGCSMLDPSIVSLSAKIALPSLVRVFGKTRLP